MKELFEQDITHLVRVPVASVDSTVLVVKLDRTGNCLKSSLSEVILRTAIIAEPKSPADKGRQNLMLEYHLGQGKT